MTDVEPPTLGEWMARPPEERVITALAHVMMNLRDLPEFACDRSPLTNAGMRWFPVQIACLEAFFMNARVATDFFVKMPSRDYTARTFLPDWQPPRGAAARLERVWEMTSKHIVHMGKDRVPTQPDNWQEEDTKYGGLMRVTRDCYSVLTAFVGEYATNGADYADEFRDMHHGVRPATLRERDRGRRAAVQFNDSRG